MSIPVHFHPSVFPETLAAGRATCLRRRRIDPKFHYESPKQAWRWLQIHELYSPARTDASCTQAYDRAFQSLSTRLNPVRPLQWISLGCGGGQKEAAWLKTLTAFQLSTVSYIPLDISPGLALTAHRAACAAGLAPDRIHPLVLDLGNLDIDNWREALAPHLEMGSQKVFSFFGMLPNFAPGSVFKKLQTLLEPDDLLLLSANLVSGENLLEATRRILPLYDNVPTQEWLMTFLWDLGVEHTESTVSMSVEACPDGTGLYRIEATCRFERDRTFVVDGEQIPFHRGESCHLFFSYRYTLAQLRDRLEQHDLLWLDSWTNNAGDEGIVLALRNETGVLKDEG